MSLRATRELPIKPYEKKPGDSMDTHVTIELHRDKERKAIRLTLSFVGIRENSRAYSLSSPLKRIEVDASPTHAPKKFAFWERTWFDSIDAKTGDGWDCVLNFLKDSGRELA